MVEVNYSLQTDESIRQTLSTSFQTLDVIPAADLQASTSYILVVYAQIGGDAANDNNEFRVTVEGTPITGAFGTLEPQLLSSSIGHFYWFVRKITTDASPADIVFEHRSTDGTTNSQCSRSQMFCIKVDDTDTDGDALHSGDYAYSESSGVLDITVANTWVNGQSVTIGNGSDDYMVLWYGRVGSGPGTGTECDSRVDVGGTKYALQTTSRSAGSTRTHAGGMLYLAAPATSTTVQAEFTSNTTLGDIDDNAIVAIRLNRFEDFAGVRDTASHPTSVSSADTDFLAATLTHTTSTAASRDWIFFGMVNVSHAEASKQIDTYMDQASVLLSGAHSGRPLTEHDPDSITNNMLIGVKNLANSVDVDIDVGVQEESDVTPSPTINEGVVVGFTAEISSGAAPDTTENDGGVGRGIGLGIARGIA